MEDEIADGLAVAFMFVVDGIKQFKYVIIATIIALVVVYWIWSINNDAEKACRNKGGVPISTDGGVKCAAGLIK